MAHAVYKDSLSQPARIGRLRNGFHSSFRSYMQLCQVLGAAPAVLKGDTNHRNSTFWTPRIKTNVHRVWRLLYFVLVVACCVIQHILFDAQFQQIENFLYTNSYYIKTISLVVILSGSHTHGCNSFFSNVLNIDEQLSALTGESVDDLVNDYKRRRIDIWRIVGLLAIILAASSVTDFFYNEMDWLSSARSCMVYIVPNATIVLCMIQYLGGLQLLRSRYQRINVALATMLPGGRCNIVPVTPFSILEVGAARVAVGSLESKLNLVRMLHFKLNQMTVELTRAFGYVLLSIFIASAFVLTIELFTIYKMIHYYNHHLNMALLVYTILWHILYGGQIYSTLLLNEMLNTEKRKIIPILYRCQFGRLNESNLILNIIQKFSIQVLHEPRSHMVCGIIPMNISTFATFCGSLVAYLVILIQFDISNRETPPEYK